ncbi:MAG: SDR family oxidoreductase [Pseudomonadota bacterium]
MANQRPLAVITGASSGIGADLARCAAADGYDTLLIARRTDRLAALAEELPGTAHIMALDVAQPRPGEAVLAKLAELGREADVLINNAGFGQTGLIAEIDRDIQTGMVDVNVRAVVDLAAAVLPPMLRAGGGGIINVGSTAAFQPGPTLAVYYATKAFVLSFSEALSEECRGTCVTITALCPGPVETEFKTLADMEKSRLFRFAKPMESPDVARIGWTGFKRGKRVVIPGLGPRIGAIGARFTPHALLLPAVKFLQSAPK